MYSLSSSTSNPFIGGYFSRIEYFITFSSAAIINVVLSTDKNSLITSNISIIRSGRHLSKSSIITTTFLISSLFNASENSSLNFLILFIVLSSFDTSSSFQYSSFNDCMEFAAFLTVFPISSALPVTFNNIGNGFPVATLATTGASVDIAFVPNLNQSTLFINFPNFFLVSSTGTSSLSSCNKASIIAILASSYDSNIHALIVTQIIPS